MGNTLVLDNNMLMVQDHPHIHGEHFINYEWFEDIRGSPPHTWGTPFSVPVSSSALRITPTYMGNTYMLKILLITK